MQKVQADDSDDGELQVAPAQRNEFEDLLEASIDVGIVDGMEQSFDFNPPEPVNMQGGHQNFEVDLAHTLDLDRQQEQAAVAATMAAAQQIKQAPVEKRKEIPPSMRSLAASTRDMLSGLGNQDGIEAPQQLGGLAQRQAVAKKQA